MGNPSDTLEAKSFANLRSKDKTATLSNRMKYFTLKSSPNKPTLITHWIITDMDVKRGRDLLRFALEQMVSFFLWIRLFSAGILTYTTVSDEFCRNQSWRDSKPSGYSSDSINTFDIDFSSSAAAACCNHIRDENFTE